MSGNRIDVDEREKIGVSKEREGERRAKREPMPIQITSMVLFLLRRVTKTKISENESGYHLDRR